MMDFREQAKKCYEKDCFMSDLRLQSTEEAYITGFIKGGKLQEDFIALLIWNIEELLPEDHMVMKSNSFRTLKHLIEN